MAAGEWIPISLLLLSLLSTATSRSSPKSQSNQHPSPPPDGCLGRRIHIRPLPTRFNRDLLRTCGAFPILDEAGFCPSVFNHGLGPRTHNGSQSWHRTDPLLFESLFHHRIREYPCLTDDFLAADAVFLPYYAALDALPFLYSPELWNSSAQHGVDLAEFLTGDVAYRRFAGHDHFLVMARPAWDFSQDPDADPPLFGTSFLTRPEFQNLTALVPESRPWPWQEHSVPHITSFHPKTLGRLDSWLARARRSRRATLMLFAGGGGGGGPNIRGSIRAECELHPRLCAVVDCANGACALNPAKYMRPMLTAKFCLQPPGDTPTRRSTFDAIIAGCVPVFFEAAAARVQYGWHLPKGEFEEFSVFIPKEDVVFGGVKIADVLGGISAARVRMMREKVLELAPRVMYRGYGSTTELRGVKDAFDLAVEGLLRRIRRRVGALSGPDLQLDEEYNIGDDDD